ncbi:MAG: tRNA lysidine(34) synthetase TilS [Betaproteobacteria bacterium]|nr:tRNA lysidine(34) synthetase TilS [Betaproteobacteria bacterium]
MSGGLDSVVLLSALHVLAPEFRLALGALHVNHQLQPEAQGWEAFCLDYCARLDIPCNVVRVAVDCAGGESLEARARELRYQAFAQQPADLVALAHHQEDQAETVLIQLLRGAGLPGLRAMPEIRPLSPGRGGPQVLRPLLRVPRDALREYAALHHLSWVEDPSNSNTHHVRNYFRHEVVPVLARRFPAWANTLGRSAAHLAEAGELLDQLAESDYSACRSGEGIRIASALALGESRAANLLRWWLRQHGAPAVHQRQLEDWLRQSCGRVDRMPSLTWGGWSLARFKGCWQLNPALSGHWQELYFESWPGGDIPIPAAGLLRGQLMQGKGVRLSWFSEGPVSVRRRQGGERLRPHPGGHSRTLRNLLQEAGLPSWWRDAMPLLFRDGQLVCVPGVAVDVSVQPGPGETGTWFQWDPFASEPAQQ